MWSAVTADTQPTDVTEHVAQLQLENATLRELLSAGRHSLVSPVCSQTAQTDMTLADHDQVDTSVSSCGETDAGNIVNSAVVEAQQHEPTQVMTAVPTQTVSNVTQSSAAAASSTSDVSNDVTQDT